MKKKQLITYVSEKLGHRVAEEAKKNNMSVSEFLSKLIVLALQNDLQRGIF